MNTLFLMIVAAIWGAVGTTQWATHVARYGHDHKKASTLEELWIVISIAAFVGPFYNRLFGFRHSYKGK